MPVQPLLAVDCAAGWKAWQSKFLLLTNCILFYFAIYLLCSLEFLTLYPTHFSCSLSTGLQYHLVIKTFPNHCKARLYFNALHITLCVIYLIIFL